VRDLIGDAHSWIPTIADSLVSLVTFFVGNRYTNKDRLRNEIAEKKRDFEIINTNVHRVVNSLNIKRKQHYFICALDINMDYARLMKEIMELQQEIDDSQQEFNRARYLIKSKSQLSKFESDVKIVTDSYQTVFDGLQELVSKFQNTISKAEEAKNITGMIGDDSDKTLYAHNYHTSCSSIAKEKERLLKVYDSQKSNLDTLFNTLQNSSKSLLDKEYEIINTLELKI
jgi:hypothetical protein